MTDADAGDISGAVWQIPSDAAAGSTYFAAVTLLNDEEYGALKYYAFTVGAEATSCNASIQDCSVEEESSTGGSAVVIIVVVVVVAAAAAAAYFFLL